MMINVEENAIRFFNGIIFDENDGLYRINLAVQFSVNESQVMYLEGENLQDPANPPKRYLVFRVPHPKK